MTIEELRKEHPKAKKAFVCSDKNAFLKEEQAKSHAEHFNISFVEVEIQTPKKEDKKEEKEDE